MVYDHKVMEVAMRTHSEMGKIEHIAGMIFKYTSAWVWAGEHSREFLESQIKELIKQLNEIEA